MHPRAAKMMGWVRWVVILGCLAVVGLCITTELVVSSSAAEVAERARVDAATAEVAPGSCMPTPPRG
jgi:hypothetical protein